MAAKELSRASDVPAGHIYNVLNSLERYHLSRSQVASRPKKYVAVEPDTVLDRLFELKRQELVEETEQYENAIIELTDKLDVAEPVYDQSWTAAISADKTIDLLVERLTAADNSLVMVVGTPSPQLDPDAVGDLVMGELEVAPDRGVDVSMFTSPGFVDSLPESVGQSYMNWLSSRSDFRTRTAENIMGVFNLVNDVKACIETLNSLNPGQAFAMIDLEGPEFAIDLRITFGPHREETAPLPL